MKKRTVGSFDGPFAPMLDLFVKQKQALGYDYGKRTIASTP